MPTYKDAQKQRVKSISARANCPASSPGEKATAKKLLENSAEPLTSKELSTKVRVWTTEASLRGPDGTRLVHFSALSYFVDHIVENTWFNHYTVCYCESFRSGDFYNILHFLLEKGLAEKSGIKYKVKDVAAVKSAWNRYAKSLTFGD